MKKFFDKVNAIILEIERQERQARRASHSPSVNTATKAIAKPAIKAPRYTPDMYRRGLGGMRI